MWGSEADQRVFGELYPLWYGPESVRDRRKAVDGFRTLADKAYAPAVYALGQAYFDGEGVRRNYPESFALFGKAAEAGYPSAEGAYGNFFIMATPKHDACPYDPAQAAVWHHRAAEHGNAGSQFNLAFSHWDGRGVEKNPVEVYLWASLAVHCSKIRMRPAENLRDQAAATLDATIRTKADERIAALRAQLPHPCSEHLSYWRTLAHRAGVCDVDGKFPAA